MTTSVPTLVGHYYNCMSRKLTPLIHDYNFANDFNTHQLAHFVLNIECHDRCIL